MAAAVALDVVGKAGGNDWSGRDTEIVLECPGKFGDTRRASVSAAHTEDGGITALLDFRP
jgi:hypothetical protein